MRCLLLITLVLASTLPSQAAVYVCETKHGFDLSAGDLTRSQSILFPRIFGFNDATGELDYGPPESQSRCDLLGKERLTIATRDSGAYVVRVVKGLVGPHHGHMSDCDQMNVIVLR
jgi:hypothetical protein